MKIRFKNLVYLFLVLPISYFIVAILFTYVTVNPNKIHKDRTEFIFLKTNGIHLDIILPSAYIPNVKTKSKYVAIGWGDKNFYLNTPRLMDISFSIAFKAMLLKSETLIHITEYDEVQNSWCKIEVSFEQLKTISSEIINQFDETNLEAIQGYSDNDKFYEAIGSYSCLFTCNSWVNSIFKNADLKSCLWTPFSFRLIEIYSS